VKKIVFAFALAASLMAAPPSQEVVEAIKKRRHNRNKHADNLKRRGKRRLAKRQKYIDVSRMEVAELTGNGEIIDYIASLFKPKN